jgi:hypothetical protein
MIRVGPRDNCGMRFKRLTVSWFSAWHDAEPCRGRASEQRPCPALQEECSYWVDDRSALGHQPVANAVDRLKIELIASLDWCETYVLAPNGL